MPLGVPGLLHALDLTAQPRRALPDSAAVRLDLGLTGTTESDASVAARPATRLPGECLTPATQSREHVLHLRQGHLGLTLTAGRVLGEDVEDQRGAVDHLDVDDLLERDELTRRELAVADHRVRPRRGDHVLQGLGLPRTDVGGGVRLVAALDQRVADLGACGLGELCQLGHRGLRLGGGALVIGVGR